jgi:hypothetical protein
MKINLVILLCLLSLIFLFNISVYGNSLQRRLDAASKGDYITAYKL